MDHIFTLYTNLLFLEHCSPKRATSVDPHLLLLHTPLVLSSWKQCLLTHPDQDLASYILDGIPKTFSIGRDSLHPLHSACKNMLLARDNPKVIEEYLQSKTQQVNIYDPSLQHTTPGVHIKSFG